MINLQKVTIFLSSSETLNFTETARALFISQQAVSKCIAELEGELGFKLFIRSYHSIELTPQGERLSRLLARSSAPCDGSFSLSENVSALFLPDMESTECLGLARTLREDMGTAGMAGTLAACVVPGGVPGARPVGGTLLKRLLGALKNLPDDGLVHRIASADLSPAPSACAIVRAEEKLFLFGGAAGRAAMRGTKCRKQ